MLIIINSPPTFKNEREYICNVILNHFLGLKYQIKYEEREDIEIYIATSNKQLYIADIFFNTAQNNWLENSSLPIQPLKSWVVDKKLLDNVDLVKKELPIIYGTELKNGSYIEENKGGIYLSLDIFGSAFFMLTRYEELVKKERDEHDRFPATTSLSYQEGFLNRPIINEYIEILWHCMKLLWPGIERKKSNFRTIVSHDVDVPFAQAFINIPQLIRNCGGDILKRKSLLLAFRRTKSWGQVKQGNYRKDTNYTFDRIMDISEQNNQKSAFYLKTACTNPNYDDNYSIEHPWVRQLLKDIYNRGHEIGIHPSYNTYRNSNQTRLEFNKLLKVCEEEGIKQNKWGGRQHYLRWQNPVTWRNWDEAGIGYDSTLSYADYAGFRCGICYEYPVYDLEQRKELKLTERPLIVMEGSVIGEKYMNLNGQEALDYMLKLKRYCRKYNGCFTLLWHNSFFENEKMWEMYGEMLGK